MWLKYDDWKNINRDSEEFWKLQEQYIYAFDEGIPIEVLPKDITMEQLTKEVEDSIKEGIDLYSKYSTEENLGANSDDQDYLKDIKLY